MACGGDVPLAVRVEVKKLLRKYFVMIFEVKNVYK